MVGEITTGQQRYERCYVTGELFDRVVIEDKEHNSDINTASKSNFFGIIDKEATFDANQCYFFVLIKKLSFIKMKTILDLKRKNLSKSLGFFNKSYFYP